MTYTVRGLPRAADAISASNATCCTPACGDSDCTTSIFIRRTFSPIQNATSVSAPASPDANTTRAAGFVLYSARNFAASPDTPAAFHCSTGANATDCAALALAGGACPAAHCALAPSDPTTAIVATTKKVQACLQIFNRVILSGVRTSAEADVRTKSKDPFFTKYCCIAKANPKILSVFSVPPW